MNVFPAVRGAYRAEAMIPQALDAGTSYAVLAQILRRDWAHARRRSTTDSTAAVAALAPAARNAAPNPLTAASVAVPPTAAAS